MSETKRCTRCQQVQALADFSNERGRPDGKRPYCKACDKAYRDAKRPSITAEDRAATKAYNQAYRARNLETLRAKEREYAREHSAARRPYLRQYQEQHRERLREQYREYRIARLDAMRAAERERTRARYQRNPQYWLDWAHKNKHRKLAYWHKRRAAKLAGGGQHTPEQWARLRDWFGARCLCCGATDRLTMDHVVPLIAGGTNTIENLQPLCHSCNSRKQNKTIDYRNPARLQAFLEILRHEQIE